MFKSFKKVLVGVLAASLMLTSVAFAADAAKSPADAPEVTEVTVKKSTVKTIKSDANVELNLSKSKTTIKAKALSKKTTSLVINSSSKKKVTVNKDAFKNANSKLKITVNKNTVTFKKGAFGKKNTKNMKIYVKGYKKTSKAFAKYKKALKAAGFKGKIYAKN